MGGRVSFLEYVVSGGHHVRVVDETDHVWSWEWCTMFAEVSMGQAYPTQDSRIRFGDQPTQAIAWGSRRRGSKPTQGSTRYRAERGYEAASKDEIDAEVI